MGFLHTSTCIFESNYRMAGPPLCFCFVFWTRKMCVGWHNILESKSFFSFLRFNLKSNLLILLTLTNFVSLLKSSFFAIFNFAFTKKFASKQRHRLRKLRFWHSIQNEKGWKKGSVMTSFLDDLKKVINHYSGRAADWKCFVQSTTVTRIRRWVQE